MPGRARSKWFARAAVAAASSLLLGALGAPPHAAAGSVGPGGGWVTTWGGAPMSPSPLVSSVQTLERQTVRNIVHTSAGGGEVRIRVTNAFGDRAVTIGAATVARQLRGAEVDAATLRRLTFGARPGVRLRPGTFALSDPIRMTVPSLANLAVSLYLPDATGPATYHQSAQQTNYLASGDHAADPAAGAYATTVGTWFFLDAVQVKKVAPVGGIVAVGDSITDGYMSQPNANTRWPDFLARRLAQRYGAAAPAVVNEGISGNRVLSDSACFGEDLLARWDRDVLGQPGVRTVVLLEGINDLGFSQLPDSDCSAPNTNVGVERLIHAYERLIERTHARGLRIYGGTLMPAQGFAYWDATAERKRQAVNAWIRESGAFDGVVDFAAVMSYPGRPELLDPRYDSGDNLHPNDAGYQAMAEAVDRALRRG
ncbi:SGNH/GDSL hydrolase family protein [Micromonospora sp. NPDC049679]|uniref:SGNH/GDSL hydrolase family protein n=1 Tax=Micromonospora sp. NPDC049679 TaxID=3155920 RepID=UPI0033E6DF25